MLGSLSKQGVQCTALPRWKQTQKSNEVEQALFFLDDELKEILRSHYGLRSSWASSVQSVIVNNVQYCCNASGHSIGDANIGYIAPGSPSIYRVGTVRKILRFQKPGSATRDQQVTLLLVAQYKKPAKAFSTHLWHKVLTHNALGTCIVGIDVQPTMDIVPLGMLIGHVAMRTVCKGNDEAILTIQLTKVCALIYSRDIFGLFG
jgi:hypothetical protein